MKKKLIKLSLSRETLGRLASQKMDKVAGGARTVIRGSCVDCSNDTCLTCGSCLTCDWSCPGQTCDCTGTCPV